MSPEVILEQPFDISSDIWSLGILAYHLLEGKTPFEYKTNKETEMKIINFNDNLEFPELKSRIISPLMKDLISKMIIRDPAKRLNVLDFLNHSLFKKFRMKDKHTVVEYSKLDNYLRKMMSFKFDCKLQQICTAMIVHNLPSDNEIKTIEKVFNSMDVDFDGYLSKEELQLGLKKFFKEKNITNPDRLIDTIYNNLDYNKSGTISYEEFICACIDKKTILENHYLKYTFSCLDYNGIGYITHRQVERLLSGDGQFPISKKLSKDLISEADINKRDGISFEDFKSMMYKLIQ
jgi:calcium-dependent protein kinase